MKPCHLPLLSLFILVLPAGVLATDGALEINQACVAGGCFPGDTTEFPVTISNPGNYVLTSNLSIPGNTGSAIFVDADNVVIDMKGFAIIGTNVCTGLLNACSFAGGGTGIASAVTRRNITVRDGLIRGMGSSGIDIGEQSTVESIITEHNALVGIKVRKGSTVRNSNSRFIGTVGIWAPESRVIDCSVADNGQYGIRVEYSIVTRATVVRTDSEVGILDVYPSQIYDSLVRDNPVGIESIYGATSVVNSTIISNSSFGIVSDGDTDLDPAGMPVLLRGNTIVLNNGGNANAQLGGSGTFVELGLNYCGADTVCP